MDHAVTAQGLRGSARRYVQHLLASTSRADGHQATAAAVDTSQKIAERLNSWQIESMQSFQMQFTSQCEHHLLPFHGTVQVFPLAPLPPPTPHMLSAKPSKLSNLAFVCKDTVRLRGVSRLCKSSRSVRSKLPRPLHV